MSVKPCKDCGQPVSSSAKQCPHCGKPQTSGDSGAQFAVAAVLGILIAWWWTSSDPEPSPAAPAAQVTPKTPAQIEADRRKSKGLSARYYCREAIKRSLHDPDSADWVPGFEWPVSVDGNRVTVQPSLRANNAFGGKVFQSFTCVVDVQGNNSRIVSIE
jgi:hypothetical protein